MSFARIFLLAMFLVLGAPQNCEPSENYFQGKCYKIIPGCFIYESTNRCSKCASGFQINQSTRLCQRQKPIETPKEKTTKVVKVEITENTRLAHQFITANNPQFRGLSYNYGSVQTTLGELITIIFKFDRFTVLVTCEGDFKQIIRGKIRAQYDDPVQIITTIQELYEQNLRGFEPLHVFASQELYEIDFINKQKKEVVRIEVDRNKIEEFESSFKIGYYEYNRIYEPYITAYLQSLQLASPFTLKNIKSYANQNYIVYEYQEGSISVSLGKCSFIINDFAYSSAAFYNYNNDQNFFKAYATVINILPFDNLPPIKKVIRNIHTNGTSLYTIEYTPANRKDMNDIDFQIVIEQSNLNYNLLSLRINYQYVLEGVLAGNNQNYKNMIECFSIGYIGQYCQKCQSFYEYLKEGDICFKVSGQKCREYRKDNNECLRCISGYDINAQGKCEESSVLIPFCQVIVNRTCNLCSEGYDLNGKGGCRQLDPLCVMYKEEACIACVPNFIEFQGVCVREIPFCKTYDIIGCTQCMGSYVLTRREPYSLCEIFRPDLRCEDYNNFKCTKCKMGYRLSLNHYCYEEIENCWNYDATNQQCLTCKTGLRVFKNRCIGMRDHVINCATDRQYRYCQQCIQQVGEYVLKNGRCQCQPGYRFFSDACVPIIENCQLVNVATFGCQICFPDFLLFAGKCITEVNGCFSYNDQGKCVRCQNGRQLSEENGLSTCSISLT